MIVAKYGGSSLADARRFQMVRDILKMDPERRFIVVSAPGKRDEDDHKITDMLLSCHDKARQNQPFEAEFSRVAARYQEIASDLGMPDALGEELDLVKAALRNGASRAISPAGNTSAPACSPDG